MQLKSFIDKYIPNVSKETLHKHIKKEVAILLALLLVFVVVAIKNYSQRVEILREKDVKVVERTASDIQLNWKAHDKIEKYIVYYKRTGNEYTKWHKNTYDNTSNQEQIECDIADLKEGTLYSVVIKTHNDIDKEFKSNVMRFSTKKKQKIKAQKAITTITSAKKINIDAEAKTKIKYKSENKNVITVNEKTGKAKIKKSGTAVVKLTAEEDNDYVKATKKIKITVLDIKTKKDTSVHIAYSLNSNNCKVVKKISGSGSIQIPQGLGYTGKKYIVAYGMSGSQRIISFEVKGKGKSVSVPKIALGHPNGFTYSKKTGLCYCVKGWSSGAVTYNPKTGKYGRMSFSYGCSGVAYDRKDECFYTSARNAIRKYSGDGKYKHQKMASVARHSGKVYTQDCGGHAGIAFHCLSGASKHGTNYIDLYDMRKGQYIGTLKCELSEVESAIVDKDGYLEILSNRTSSTDYIYKTPINIEQLAEEL